MTSLATTELADDELVADKVVMVGDVPLKVLVGKVGEIAHNDVLVFDIGLTKVHASTLAIGWMTFGSGVFAGIEGI